MARRLIYEDTSVLSKLHPEIVSKAHLQPYPNAWLSQWSYRCLNRPFPPLILSKNITFPVSFMELMLYIIFFLASFKIKKRILTDNHACTLFSCFSETLIPLPTAPRIIHRPRIPSLACVNNYPLHHISAQPNSHYSSRLYHELPVVPFLLFSSSLSFSLLYLVKNAAS